MAALTEINTFLSRILIPQILENKFIPEKER